jgi:YfiH family protein
MQAAPNCHRHENRLLFPAFSRQHLFHGVFTREGGVSSPPWNSLNVGFNVGDTITHVEANRKIIKRSLQAEALVSANQVHGDKVYVVDKRPPNDLEVDGFDSLITNLPGIGLMVQHADCQAVLVYDSKQKAAAIIHVGWRGSVANIIETTITAMIDTYGVNPIDLLVAIGPSLGPCCAEFVNFQKELPYAFLQYRVQPNYFDFWAISRHQILQTGVPQEQIFTAGICTVCNPLFFSYRRDKVTGRCASAIGIQT